MRQQATIIQQRLEQATIMTLHLSHINSEQNPMVKIKVAFMKLHYYEMINYQYIEKL